MPHFLLRFASRFVLTLNIILIALFLLACLVPFLNPDHWWFAGFLGLLFPYLLFLLLLFLIICLFFKPRWSLFTFVVILLGWNNIAVLIGWHFFSSFSNEKAEGRLRVMDWNVRHFVPYYSQFFNLANQNNEQAIVDEIRNYQPDVVCFQEFIEWKDTINKISNLDRIRKELGLPYAVFSRDFGKSRKARTGTAILSRYPIIDSGIIRFPENMQRGAESLVSADIVFQSDTFRVFSMHLESFRFLHRDYEDLGRIRNQTDSALEASRNIFRKMRQAFSLRGKQADFVRENIRSSPYPEIICGDLNDVPNSYAYFRIRGNLRDAFLEKGWGLGNTFSSSTSKVLQNMPTLRIDLILTHPALTVHQFRKIPRRLSDHMPIIADLEIGKK